MLTVFEKDAMDDMNEKINWCEEHLDDCEKIAKASTKFVTDIENEDWHSIENEVLNLYVKCIHAP